MDLNGLVKEYFYASRAAYMESKEPYEPDGLFVTPVAQMANDLHIDHLTFVINGVPDMNDAFRFLLQRFGGILQVVADECLHRLLPARVFGALQDVCFLYFLAHGIARFRKSRTFAPQMQILIC